MVDLWMEDLPCDGKSSSVADLFHQLTFADTK